MPMDQETWALAEAAANRAAAATAVTAAHLKTKRRTLTVGSPEDGEFAESPINASAAKDVHTLTFRNRPRMPRVGKRGAPGV